MAGQLGAFLTIGYTVHLLDNEQSPAQRKADIAEAFKLVASFGLSKTDLPADLQAKVENWVASGDCRKPVGEESDKAAKPKKRTEKPDKEEKPSKKAKAQPKDKKRKAK